MPVRVASNNPTHRFMASRLCAIAVLCLLVGLPALATEYNSQNRDNPTNKANPWTADIANEVGIIEKLNSPVPTDLTFIDEDGKPVKLSSFFEAGRPVVFNLGYSRCPSICPQMRNQLVGKLAETDLALGEDFIVLNISIDPEEPAAMSRDMRARTMEELKDAGVDAAPEGWRYLTADESTIKQLTAAVGYRYLYIKPQNEYGHPGVLVLADGEGVIRRYLSGMTYSGRTLRMSIVEVSQGKVGSLLDKAFVKCFSWDPDANNYAATARFIMMIGGGVTVVVMAGLLFFGFQYEKRKRTLAQADPDKFTDAMPAH